MNMRKFAGFFIVLTLMVNLLNAKRSLFVWTGYDMVLNYEKAEAMFAFCFAPHRDPSKKIELLYFCPDSGRSNSLMTEYPNKLRSFIEDAHSRGIKVYYSNGGYRWATPLDKTNGLIKCESIIDFNKNTVNAKQRFDGILYDVEPYVLNGTMNSNEFGWNPDHLDWDTMADARVIWTQYCQLLMSCQSKVDTYNAMYDPDIEFGNAIPRWYESSYSFVSHQTNQDIMDFIAIMDYYDQGTVMASDAENELTYGDLIGKEVVIIAETGTNTGVDPKTVTFFQEGNEIMEQEIDIALNSFTNHASFREMCIHYYQPYSPDNNGEGIPDIPSAFSGTTPVYYLERAPLPTVLYPNGGETIWGNTEITWSAVDSDSDPVVIDIHYSSNGGTNWNLVVSNTPNTGQFLWDTTLLPNGNNYLIHITAKESSAYNLTGWDESNNSFTLGGTGPAYIIIESVNSSNLVNGGTNECYYQDTKVKLFVYEANNVTGCTGVITINPAQSSGISNEKVFEEGGGVYSFVWSNTSNPGAYTVETRLYKAGYIGDTNGANNNGSDLNLILDDLLLSIDNRGSTNLTYGDTDSQYIMNSEIKIWIHEAKNLSTCTGYIDISPDAFTEVSNMVMSNEGGGLYSFVWTNTGQPGDYSITTRLFNAGFSSTTNSFSIRLNLLAISNFSADVVSNFIKLQWQNPDDPLFQTTLIRYKTNSYPIDENDGNLIGFFTNVPGSFDSYNHTNVIHGITYYYSAFAQYEGGVYADAEAWSRDYSIINNAAQIIHHLVSDWQANKEIPLLVQVKDDEGIKELHCFYRETDKDTFISMLFEYTGKQSQNYYEYKGIIPAQQRAGDLFYYFKVIDNFNAETLSPAGAPAITYKTIILSPAEDSSLVLNNKVEAYKGEHQTVLNISVKEESTVNIQIYSVNGKMIKNVVNDKRYYPGTYEIPVNTQEFSSGLYFIVYKFNQYKKIKRLMIIQ